MILAGASVLSGSVPAHAQTVSPIDMDQARREAERAAAERSSRQAGEIVGDAGPQAPAVGPIPEGESPCFAISHIIVNGAEHRRLRWVPGHVADYRGRCLGARGLDHVLRSLQAEFLDRGLITTRAGLPEQDMSTGTLVVQVVPGLVSAVRTNGEDKAFGWSLASPVDRGDIVTLRALEQGIEQIRRIPGREAGAELVPGGEIGGSIIEVTDKQKRPFTVSVSLDNYAGKTVGDWQGSVQGAALNLLGASEIVSAYYNRRVDAPGIPADSRGYGGSMSFPLGWWTFGVSGSNSRYSQQVEGEVATFETLGRLGSASVFADRVLQRGQVSKTSLRASLTRRWGRNYIEDVEIGIQRQDVTDLTLALIDRRDLGFARLDSALSYRIGLDLLGAQDEGGRPAALPTSRFRIFTADIAAQVPIRNSFLEAWTIAFRGQVSGDRLYGSDSFSIGGPFTVRGYDSDASEIARSGWYVRQELVAKAGDHLRPFLLVDIGHVREGSDLLAGVGAGLRAQWRGFRFDGFAALPVTGSRRASSTSPTVGISLGWSL